MEGRRDAWLIEANSSKLSNESSLSGFASLEEAINARANVSIRSKLMNEGTNMKEAEVLNFLINILQSYNDRMHGCKEWELLCHMNQLQTELASMPGLGVDLLRILTTEIDALADMPTQEEILDLFQALKIVSWQQLNGPFAMKKPIQTHDLAKLLRRGCGKVTEANKEELSEYFDIALLPRINEYVKDETKKAFEPVMKYQLCFWIYWFFILDDQMCDTAHWPILYNYPGAWDSFTAPVKAKPGLYWTIFGDFLNNMTHEDFWQDCPKTFFIPFGFKDVRGMLSALQHRILPGFVFRCIALKSNILEHIEDSKHVRTKVIAALVTGGIAVSQFVMRIAYELIKPYLPGVSNVDTD